MAIEKISATVYMLIDCGWDNLGESCSETERCLGIFTSKELVVKAANDFLKQVSENIQEFDKEDYAIPETPLTFEQLDDDSCEYYSHPKKYYGARLYLYTYELDKLKI